MCYVLPTLRYCHPVDKSCYPVDNYKLWLSSVWSNPLWILDRLRRPLSCSFSASRSSWKLLSKMLYIYLFYGEKAEIHQAVSLISVLYHYKCVSTLSCGDLRYILSENKKEMNILFLFHAKQLKWIFKRVFSIENEKHCTLAQFRFHKIYLHF